MPAVAFFVEQPPMDQKSPETPDNQSTPNVRKGKQTGSGVVDQRLGLDRREIAAARGDTTGLERRRGPGRRLSDFSKAAEEGEMNKEQFLFLVAINEFKKANEMTFPSWTDVLEVVRLLGYRKTCESEITLRAAEDWQEAPNAAANVRPQRWAERFKDKKAA